MIKNILKVGVIAFAAMLFSSSPIFAACDLTTQNTYTNIGVVKAGTAAPDGKPVKCTAATFSYDNETYDIYAKSSVDCASASQISQNPAGFCENNTDVNNIIQTAINIIIWFVGILSVIIIIVGGILYSTSLGDPGKVKKAKDTIMYGIVGLVIAILAFAIVRFILGMFSQ